MESFRDNLKVSKSFRICVKLVDGSYESSSSVPMDLLEEAVGDIMMVEGEGMGLTIWDRESNKSITFGRGQIMSVSIEYSRL
jgi:hypothetical protein